MEVMYRLFAILLLSFFHAAIADRYHGNARNLLTFPSKGAVRNGKSGNSGIWDNTDWKQLANAELERALQVTAINNKNRAKNVILFIGDGLGISTLAAARLYNAEMKHLQREDIYLAWEKFPHVAFSRTYNVDRSTPDSAGTGTAYMCGVKANMETIGVNDKVKFGDCSAVEGNKVRSIVKESIREDKWTGLVTTTKITHASPAAGYAHVSDRDWEAYMPSRLPSQIGCDDIAYQLVHDDENKQIRVIFGGGRRMFLSNNTTHPQYNDSAGNREDGRDLIREWIDEGTGRQFVKNKAEFDAIKVNTTEPVMGLFSFDHMSYEADRTAEEPSLAEMTRKAIEILEKSDNGYFLFVEGGRIDHSHHATIAYKALNDTIAFSDAVQTAVDITHDNETLIIVSADHSHVFTFGGYGSFQQSVFDVTDSGYANDGKPFLQMNYANGPGYDYHHLDASRNFIPRKNITGDNLSSKDYRQDAAVPLGSETHGGEDVAIFAHGPMSHLFHGVHEQNYIARVMMYASCVGEGSRGPSCPARVTMTTAAANTTTSTAAATTTTTATTEPITTISNPRTPDTSTDSSISPFVNAENDFDPYHSRSDTNDFLKSRSSERETVGSFASIWDNQDWTELANKELARAEQVAESYNENVAKNVIFFIGDGLGVSTLSAARLYHAELRQLSKEDIYLSWEKFAHVGLSRTYNVDRSTPDSAGTGTAYMCGIKANMETIGVNDKVKFGDCSAVKDNKVRSIVKESIREGKWTGLVTTTRITHASPAAGYAHVSDRDWEAYMPSKISNQLACDDIAKQLVRDEENQQIRVILGGGRQMFLPNVSYPEFNNEMGLREDNLNLINEWRSMSPSRSFVKNKQEFDYVKPENTDYLMGLFSSSHMEYEADRKETEQPSLAEMTSKAIEILNRSAKGYFLFVEGGRIDHSHHDARAHKALRDTVAFADAVQTAVNMTNSNETLIVVSADHSHVFTFGGYATFQQSILRETDDSLASDNKSFLQLHYANGGGFYDHRNGTNQDEIPRRNLTELPRNSTDPLFRQDSSIPLSSETHGGEDVAIFAHGPMSHLFHGVHEQNYIARVMMYASCVGEGSRGLGCPQTPSSAVTSQPSTTAAISASDRPLVRQWMIVSALVFILFVI